MQIRHAQRGDETDLVAERNGRVFDDRPGMHREKKVYSIMDGRA